LAKKNFHNHLSHQILTAYALGASSQVLENIGKQYDYLRDKPPHKMDITVENWLEHLGHNELWTDYLTFFDKMVKEKGIRTVINEYTLKKQMLPRLVSGAFHPLIQLGFGIEFDDPMIVAEGLAGAACHENRFKDIIDQDFWELNQNNDSILDIAQQIKNDNRFDGILSYEDENKLTKILSNKTQLIKEYALKFGVTYNNLYDRLKEAHESIILIYAASAQRPDKNSVRLDFFFVHGVTSIYFMDLIFEIAESKKHCAVLLKAHFAAVLTYYITRGRPHLHPDLLFNYKSREEEVPTLNPWLYVIDQALRAKDVHVVKTIRSLMKADMKWTGEDTNKFLKAAILTIDNINDSDDWSFNGIGWDQDWNQSGKA
jgi:hypothetical protein